MASKVKFTKVRVQDLIKTAGEHRDEQSEAGLGLRVSPKGKAVWFVEFDFEGKHYNRSLGRVPKAPSTGKALPELQLDDARDKARAYRLSIENPAGVPDVVTLREQFEDYVENKRRRPREKAYNLSAKSQAAYMAAFNQHLGAYADRDYRSIGEKEWREIYTEIEKGKTKDGEPVMLRPMMRKLKDGTTKEVKPKRPSKGSVAQAHILMSALSGMYEFNRVENPIKLLRKGGTFSRAPKSRKTWVTFEELHRFMVAVRGLSSAVARDSLLISLLTCFRRELVLGMRKDRLDCNSSTYLVDETDPGYKRAPTLAFPLNKWLVETVLRPLNESNSYPHPVYLFPSQTGKGETVTSLANSIDNLEKAFGKRINSNCLRRTYTTVGSWVGTRQDDLNRLTGHAVGAGFEEKGSRTTAEYVMTETEMLRPAQNRITNAILELAGVLPLTTITRARLAEEMPTLLITLENLSVNARAA